MATDTFASLPPGDLSNVNIKEPPTVQQRDIAALASEIAARFDPERIILFGSYAYGQPTEDSDVDLLVVMPFEGKAFRKAVEILVEVHPGIFPIDLIVRRPGELEARYTGGDPLIGDAVDFGKVLYARRN